MLISGAMLLGPPTGLHAVCTRVLACVPCVLAREDVWWSGSRLECQAHLSEGDAAVRYCSTDGVAGGFHALHCRLLAVWLCVAGGGRRAHVALCRYPSWTVLRRDAAHGLCGVCLRHDL